MTRRLDAEERVALIGLVATFVVTAAWWALALWPVSDSPYWLARTRYVCFGVGDSGLPDAGGWVGLIGGPMGMLGIVLVGWARGVGGIVKRARTSLPIAATLAVLTLGSISMVAGAGLRVRQADAARLIASDGTLLPASTYPRLDKPAPALALIAQDGAVHSLEELKGRPAIVTFAYAHCTTICPIIVRDVLSAQKLVQERGDETPVVLVVSLDPWRDTPSRLPGMAKDWQFPAQDAWVMSGDVKDVEAVLNAWNVPHARNEQNGDVTHPSLAYIIDKTGRIAYASSGGAHIIAELVGRL